MASPGLTSDVLILFRHHFSCNQIIYGIYVPFYVPEFMFNVPSPTNYYPIPLRKQWKVSIEISRVSYCFASKLFKMLTTFALFLISNSIPTQAHLQSSLHIDDDKMWKIQTFACLAQLSLRLLVRLCGGFSSARSIKIKNRERKKA